MKHKTKLSYFLSFIYYIFKTPTTQNLLAFWGLHFFSGKKAENNNTWTWPNNQRVSYVNSYVQSFLNLNLELIIIFLFKIPYTGYFCDYPIFFFFRDHFCVAKYNTLNLSVRVLYLRLVRPQFNINISVPFLVIT